MATDTPYQEPHPHDHKQPDVNDYSGLQVVETGLEVVPPSPLPEALPPHQQTQYAEYKPWPQYSPQQDQPPPPHPGFAQPAPIDSASAPNGGGMVPDYQYHGGHNPFGPPREKTGSGRICGLRRVVFWAILAIVAFAIVAAVAIGVGVGLGTRSSASTPTATPTSSSSVTESLPAATATSTTGPELNIVCPSANRTVYSLASSSTDQKFLVLCGRDYNGCCGAQDMVSVNTTTFEGCLEVCGNQEGCVAVGWGNYYGTNTCWLKSAIGEPSWSEGWYAAVME